MDRSSNELEISEGRCYFPRGYSCYCAPTVVAYWMTHSEWRSGKIQAEMTSCRLQREIGGLVSLTTLFDNVNPAASDGGLNWTGVDAR